MKTVLVLFLMFLTVLVFSQDLTLTDQDNLDVYIEIPGGQDIHMFALEITVTGTTTLETACSITYPGGSQPAFSTNNSGLVVSGSSLDYEISTTGTLVAGTATYTMNVIVQPVDGGNPNNNGVITAAESWTFQLFTLTTPNTIEITAQGFENKFGEITVNDTIDLPPTAVITIPAGSSITRTPTSSVDFAGDGNDDRAGFTHEWTHTITSTTTPFSTDENPVPLTLSTIGTYDIEYIVTDSNGQTATDTFQVIVEAGNSPPLALLTSESELFGRSPFEAEFDGSASSDPDGNLETYIWDFGDGNSASTVVPDPPTVTHNYLTGTYTGTLETKDDLGLTSASTADTQIYAASNEKIYFPKHIGLPYDWLPPSIDGMVTDDHGWRGAYQIIHAGGTSADMVFQGLQDKSADFLYHSFQIYDEDGSGDANDLIVLGYRVDQTLSNSLVPIASDRLLFIFPFQPDASNSTSYTIKIYQHNGTGWSEISNSLAGFEIGTDNSVTNQWTVELKVPTNAQSTVWNTLNNDFLFTYYVFNTIGNGTVFERHWPRDVEDVTGYAAVPSVDNFSPFWWGLASKGNTVVRNGIGFHSSNDIGIMTDPDNPETTLLSTGQVPVHSGQPVTFGARVSNYTAEDIIDPSGNPAVQGVGVNNIKVRFKMANWGIADPYGEGGWNEIGVGNVVPIDLGSTTPNPGTISNITAPTYAPATGITPETGTATIEWTPNAAAENAYNPGTGRLYTYHQCFYAEIVNDEDMASNLIVFNRSTHRNMNFGTASDFEQPAQINPEGFGPAPEGQNKHRFLLQIIRKTWEEDKDPDSSRTLTSPDKLAGRGKSKSGRTESFIQWEAKAFIYTGENVIIDNTEYELVKSAGSFGSIVSHDDVVVNWNYSIDGAKKVDDDQFIVEVSPDKIKELTIKIEPKEYYPWSLSIHGGTTTPIGSYASSQSTGYNVGVDFGYRFSKIFGLKLYTGYNQFTKNVTPAPYLINLNLDLQYIIPFNRTLDLYLQVGPGLYFDDSIQPIFGYNAGIGANYQLSNHLLLSLGTDYHSDFNSQRMFANICLGCNFLF